MRNTIRLKQVFRFSRNVHLTFTIIFLEVSCSFPMSSCVKSRTFMYWLSWTWNSSTLRQAVTTRHHEVGCWGKSGKLEFVKKDLIIFEEKNTTYRAKKRFFELFPVMGLKSLLPKELFLINKNLDAISALIILEDYCNDKFTVSQDIDIKTWLK